jgi:carbonic anhydrase/acetyltransferase-like protein (isoleucine patch superfamily)
MKEPRAGRVRLDPTAFVAPGAVLIGEVTVGRRASVWFNTVVRGDVDAIEIGEASNVQDNSTLHVDAGQPVRIGARVTVGHRAIVHGCVIEDDCLIGMGSVLLSGCRIGSGSYLGASSLVLEGMQIPPGSVALGAPARVTGSTLERHQAGIRHGSETYAELASACMARGMARPVARNGELAQGHTPMTWSEWQMRLDSLAALPLRIEARGFERGGAASDSRRTIALIDRAAESDRKARRPLLGSLLRSEAAMVPGDTEEGKVETSADIGQAIAAWKEERARLVAALRPLRTADWWRLAGHPTRGPFTLAELVREWIEEDLERLAALDPRRESAS